eukprot:15464789-Alexandrium_andersonii.AAC.1
MQDSQRRVIEEALGTMEGAGGTLSSRTWRLDSGQWSPFSRNRLFFSTLPGEPPSMRPAPRADPWEE